LVGEGQSAIGAQFEEIRDDYVASGLQGSKLRYAWGDDISASYEAPTYVVAVDDRGRVSVLHVVRTSDFRVPDQLSSQTGRGVGGSKPGHCGPPSMDSAYYASTCENRRRTVTLSSPGARLEASR
jgi:hypothetical protein